MKTSCSLYLASFAMTVALAGCGGSSAVSAHSTGTLNFAGSAAITTTSTTDATMNGSGGTAVSTGDATTGGTAVIPSGVQPAGTTIPAGTNLAIIPAGVGFLGTFANFSGLAVNSNRQCGIGVSNSGFTQVNTALPVDTNPGGTFYSIEFPTGALNTSPSVVGTVTPDTLTIGNATFEGSFYVVVVNNRPQVISPLPISLVGRIPNNGENAGGSHIVANFGPGNNGRTATLAMSYGNGFRLQQERTIKNNQVQFDNFEHDTSDVPKTGVSSLALFIGPLP